MSEHLGISSDTLRHLENVAAVAADHTLMLCRRCGGTGNELYAMYRQCTQCGGVGVVDATMTEGDT